MPALSPARFPAQSEPELDAKLALLREQLKQVKNGLGITRPDLEWGRRHATLSMALALSTRLPRENSPCL